jgi:hypothetical protein
MRFSKRRHSSRLAAYEPVCAIQFADRNGIATVAVSIADDPEATFCCDCRREIYTIEA